MFCSWLRVSALLLLCCALFCSAALALYVSKYQLVFCVHITCHFGKNGAGREKRSSNDRTAAVRGKSITKEQGIKKTPFFFLFLFSSLSCLRTFLS